MDLIIKGWDHTISFGHLIHDLLGNFFFKFNFVCVTFHLMTKGWTSSVSLSHLSLEIVSSHSISLSLVFDLSILAFRLHFVKVFRWKFPVSFFCSFSIASLHIQSIIHTVYYHMGGLCVCVCRPTFFANFVTRCRVCVRVWWVCSSRSPQIKKME